MKTNFTLKIVCIFSIMLISINIQAQVTIGANTPPNKNALLELTEDTNGSSSKGLLMPRVALVSTTLANPMDDHVKGMTVYNTDTIGDVIPGFYYNDGTKWVRVIISDDLQATPRFFYMPSFNLPLGDTSTDPFHTYDGTKHVYDLYAQYEKQLTMPSLGTSISSVFGRNNIDFIITAHDENIITPLSIDNGQLSYLVLSKEAPLTSFINIVIISK